MSLVGFTRIAEYELPVITDTHNDFVVLLKFADFTAAALAKLDDGGGDLRFSSDIAGTNQLPCHVVNFEIVGASIQVWVRIPAAFTGAVIHIWGDNTGVSQPTFGDAFGRNSVFVGCYAAYIFNTAGVQIDLTGNGNDLTPFGTESLQTGQFGDSLYFNGSNTYYKATGNIRGNTSFEIEAWVSVINTPESRFIFDDSYTAGLQTFVLGSAGTVRSRIDDNAGVNSIIDSPYVVEDAGFTQVHSSVDKNGVFQEYINGIASGNSAAISSLGDISASSDLYVGVQAESIPSPATRGFKGVISNLFIRNGITNADYKRTSNSNQGAVGAWGIMTDVVASGTESYSGSNSFNISTALISSGVKSSNTAAQIDVVTTNLAKGKKHAQAVADLSTTSNVVSTGNKLAFSLVQNNINSVINASGVKHSFGISNINVATSFTISGTAAELIIKSGVASLSVASSINSIGYKSSLSNVSITELSNTSVAGYKYALASANINIATNNISSGEKSSDGRKSENQSTALNSVGTKCSYGNSSLSTSTIVMSIGIGGSFVPISRKTIIHGRINTLILNGQISSGLTIRGVF